MSTKKLSLKRKLMNLCSSLWKGDQFYSSPVGYSGILIFRALKFSKLPILRTKKSFPLDLLCSDTVILPSLCRTFDSAKLPIFRTNSWLPSAAKFAFDFSKFGKKCNAMEGNAAKSPRKIYTCIDTVLVFVLLNFFHLRFVCK